LFRNSFQEITIIQLQTQGGSYVNSNGLGKTTQATINHVDFHNHEFQTIVTNWKKIFAIMMKVECSSHVKNELACKNKREF